MAKMKPNSEPKMAKKSTPRVHHYIRGDLPFYQYLYSILSWYTSLAHLLTAFS